MSNSKDPKKENTKKPIAKPGVGLQPKKTIAKPGVGLQPKKPSNTDELSNE